jgi:vacuolar-type H+-ATPase subunit C/Vma6
MEYYSLVAGLRQYAPDSTDKDFNASAIIEEIASELSGSDRKSMRLFYNYYDIENIIGAMAGRAHFSELGTLSAEQIAEEVQRPTLLPQFLANILTAFAEPDNAEFDDIDRSKAIEKALFEAYYKECAQSGNRFLRQWAEFDRNLRNVCAAASARKIGKPISSVIVGTGDVADALLRSSAADFGLRNELDYMDEVLTVIENESDMLKQEHALDTIRWNMSDELSVFDYFNMNAVFAYLVKINLVYRWMALDKERGQEMFEKLIASFDGKELIKKAEQMYDNN